MNRELYQRVSDWFEERKEDMARDIMRLVRIDSVSNPDAPVKPFGQGCRLCMDEMLKIGEEHGFYTENYEYYVGSIGKKEKNWENLIGFWNHLDVVPVGNDWDYEPFSPVRKEHFIIGRGSQDNKGPAIGILYLMECLRELQIPMKHELCLFVGCDEERGMSDMEYYSGRYPFPKMSMIADSGFPVCYGEKGILEGKMYLKGKLPKGLLDCGGGSASNMIPDMAYAVLERTEELEQELKGLSEEVCCVTEGSSIRMTVKGTSKHSAFPEGSKNAIYELGKTISALNSIGEDTKELFRKLAHLSQEYYGKNFGLEYQDEVSGRTTCAATVLCCENGKLSLNFNIRYAITDDSDKIEARMVKKAESCGMVWETERDSAPNYFPAEHPAVKLLTDLYNDITGEQKESFVMGGGTYARKLPNAFAYGVGGMKQSEEDIRIQKQLFRPGHGGAHEPDEALNLRLLLEAMKIYTMSVIELNDISL